MTNRHRANNRPAQALAIALAFASLSSLLSCDNRYNTSTLIINEIIDPLGLPSPIVHIALSRTPEFSGGVKTYATSYDISNPSTPAVVFESIIWKDKDEREAGEFWLLIVEDSDANGMINNGDYVLPSMRIVLRDGEQTVINRIIYETAPVMPFRTISMFFNFPQYKIRFFIEDPSKISSATPLYLRLGTTTDLSQTAGPHPHDIPIVSPALSSGFFVYTASTYALLWLDIDSSGTLTIGDWISWADEENVPPLDPSNQWILWSGQTVLP